LIMPKAGESESLSSSDWCSTARILLPCGQGSEHCNSFL
jgi:hypothetical protein